jgi:hypothetical protein
MNPRLPNHYGCAVRNGLVTACMISLLCTACGAPSAGPAARTPAASASEQTPAGDVVVRVTVSGGIAGKSSTWTVHADGRVESDSGLKRQRTSAQVDALRNGLRSAGFFDLADSYGGRQCRDCFVYDITVIDGTKTKTVRITDDGKLPAPVGEALAQINKVLAE